MGVTVPIAPLTYSQVVTQNLSLSRDYVEVGALFPATVSYGAAPTFVGSYWDDQSGGGTGSKTVNNSGYTGEVNSGVVAATSGTCVAAPSAGTEQSCNSWCHGGDTLIYGLAGRSAGVSAELSTVTFNISGTPAQNVQLTRFVHFPDTGGGTANASGTIYSEIWVATNADYLSSTSAPATSYPAAVLGTVGAHINLSSSMSGGTTTMEVSSVVGAGSKICVDDLLSTYSGNNRFVSGTKITATPGGATCNSAAGTYTFDTPTTSNMNAGTVPLASSKNLIVQGQAGIAFTAGATNNGAVTIASGPVASIYTLSTETSVPISVPITQGSAGSGDTIRVSTSSSLPSVGTRVALFTNNGGAGAFAANTTVQSVGANSFVVSPAPTAAIEGGVACGGTCAFFNGPSSTSSVTEFRIERSTVGADTSQWSSGFACLKGVDASLIAPVTSSTVKPGRWQEQVQ
ncbi:hypothetical protein EEB15_25270 [Ramlibacter sp. WS9]|nr:hypothetical protein EEB15_25270 [Ramlibacter sp. WS9]